MDPAVNRSFKKPAALLEDSTSDLTYDEQRLSQTAANYCGIPPYCKAFLRNLRSRTPQAPLIGGFLRHRTPATHQRIWSGVADAVLRLCRDFPRRTTVGAGGFDGSKGFEQNGGHLTSIEIDGEMVKTARANVRKMQLEKVVTVVQGEAIKVIPTLDGPFDVVFLDAAK